ncbi:MAG: diguanylate cyclase [Eubacteriales bacterium]
MEETKKISPLVKMIILSLLIYIVLSSIFFVISFAIDRSEDEAIKTHVLNHENIVTHVERTLVSDKIEMVSSDLLYIADTLRIGYERDDFEDISNEWLAFSDRQRIYDQIRFIDIDGNEIIRINLDAKNGPYIVDKSSLQNKKDRYYFTESISLDENYIYISQLDLNIENDIVEEPIKPVIRFAMPFFDTHGKLRGIVVINYLADDLLNRLDEISSTSNGYVFMLNSDGYWMYNNESPEYQWTFMYDGLSDINFQNEYPEEWDKMQRKTSNSIISENGVFTYKTTLGNTSILLGEDKHYHVDGLESWKIVSYIPSNSEYGTVFTENFIQCSISVIKDYIIVYPITLLVSLLIAFFAVENTEKRKRIKYFSEYDTMTNVLNRRAGYEKLGYISKTLDKNPCSISICFIDINGLKSVNDTLGHDAGDELILTVIDEIKKNIRENDFISRLGGDEFLVVFTNADKKKAESIWQRIKDGLDYINENESRKYLVSASHGIETFNCEKDKYFDTIISSADEKMYEEKKLIKKSIQILRA